MKMTDSMQFGPEWLRNLSQHDNENTMVMPKYQLAEHRYGREEMLALFDKSVAAPEPLRSISGLYVDKIQLPLALIQMSEEETRVWNSNATHDTTIRGLTKTIPGNLTNVSPMSGGPGLARGRGTSVDRGRGRGTRGLYHYNNRNYSEDGTESSHPNTTFGRPRIFDRSQSHTSERNWSERNGNVEYNDWNGYTNNVENGLSTSPRKDFGSSMRTTTTREDTNWRRRPAKDDDDTWRSTRHGRGYTNWREGGERDGEKEKDQDGPEPGKDRRWMSRVVSMHVSGGHPNRRNSEGREDSLPEWATESPSEGGGSFDSSGAFHGSNSDDDEHDRKERSISEIDKISNKKDDRKIDENRAIRVEQKLLNDQKKNKVKEKSPSPAINENNKSKDQESSKLNSTPSPPISASLIRGESPNLNNSQSLSQHLHKSIIPSQSTTSTSSDSYNNLHPNVSKEIPNMLADPHKSSQTQKLQHDLSHAQAQSGIDMISSSSSGYDSNFSLNHNENTILSMNVSNYQNLPNSNVNSLENKLLMSSADIINNTLSSLERSKSASVVNPLSTMHGFNMASSNVRIKGKEEELDGIVVDVVSKIMEEEGNVEAIKRLESINKWYYRDPQGVMQGPFTSAEMAEWYRLGYFHDKSLLVRRACETQYYPLHDLVTLYNGAPFDIITLQNINNYRPPPPAASLSSTPATVPSMNMPTDDLLYYQQQLQYRSIIARQQQDLAVQNAIRHLSQSDRWKTLSPHEQQRLIVQHVSSSTDMNAAAIPQVTVPQPSVPLIPNYVHPPMQPNVPNSNPALVLLLSQMQQQQQQQQHQQQQQQQHQQQQHQTQHHHLQQQMHLHQQLQHQQQQVQSQTSNQDVKQDRLQTNLMHQLDPLQQLVVKMNMQASNQGTAVVQPQGGNAPQISLSNSVSQSITAPSAINEDSQPNNPIHNLLKQLGVSTEKPAKIDSVWGPSTSTTPPSVPLLNNNAFNPQHWLSQVGRIGPASASINNGLWTAEGTPSMKTEQQIIESLMKDKKPDDARKEIENNSKLLELKKQEEIKLQQEELLRKTAEEKKKKLEEKKQKEEEKRIKQIQEEERLKKLEEEKRKKAVEDAKRKEEERRRKEEEKRRKEEEKEKKKADDDKKKQDQKRKETEELQRKQAESIRRLKEQQLHASGGNKLSLKSVPSSINEQDQARSSDSIPKLAKQNSTLSNKTTKSQSSDENRKQNSEANRTTENEKQAGNKQLPKSKSTSSVPTHQNQKSGESEKKEKKKKEKAPVNAWADQKKVPNVKSLAEIQAEEQKQLAKQIEREKAERLLQQQQAAAAAALAAKENATGNIWNSQSVPWKNSPNWAAPSPPAPSALANSRSEQSVPSKAWNEPSRGTSNIASNSVATKSPTNTACTSNTNRSATNSINSSSQQQQPQKAAMANVSKSKPKKEDAKKTTPTVTVANKNDELSKWGIKALSGLKPAVDVPTFITFLRDVESPNDVMEYVTDYLGDGKEAKNFVKQFLERRSVLVSGSSGSVMMSSTAITALTTVTGGVKKTKKKTEDDGSSANKTTTKQPASKQNSMEFTEVKGKVKKGKKKPIMRLDNALLGFNVTAAPDRINIGDRDYGEDFY